jgi:Uma2 family endonuclease
VPLGGAHDTGLATIERPYTDQEGMDGSMSTALRFTTSDLLLLPDDGKRYELIDGDILISRSPTFEHQFVLVELVSRLRNWNGQTGLGIVLAGLGLVLSETDSVIPDLIWGNRERIAAALDATRHLGLAPELVVEILSPGSENDRRDRELKLRLYSRQGVDEYWIVDWQSHMVQVYRRVDAALTLFATYRDGDTLTSPLLPGFSLAIDSIWPTI